MTVGLPPGRVCQWRMGRRRSTRSSQAAQTRQPGPRISPASETGWPDLELNVQGTCSDAYLSPSHEPESGSSAIGPSITPAPGKVDKFLIAAFRFILTIIYFQIRKFEGLPGPIQIHLVLCQLSGKFVRRGGACQARA